MLIGHHFGKRKPRWNFFIQSYEVFKYSSSAQLVKLVLIGFVVQVLLFMPVIYWIYQNYAIIEATLPSRLNLIENIQFEKKWILFLIFGMSLVQGFWNYTIWKGFLRSQAAPPLDNLSTLKSVSRDEADSQRRAS